LHITVNCGILRLYSVKHSQILMTSDDRLGLRIPPELKQVAQEKAEAEDLTLSQVVRRLLRQWVAKDEQPEEKEGQEDK